MDAVLDLLRVLYEPGAVFARVREKPKVLAPMIGITIVMVGIAILQKPYVLQMMIEGAVKAGRPAESVAPMANIGIYGVLVGMPVGLLVGAGFLWLLVSVTGGDAKFKTLLSICTYISVIQAIGIGVGLLSLYFHPGVAVHSNADMSPPVGLDRLFPDVSPILHSVLATFNLFGIWATALTALGVQITHNTSKGRAWTVAILGFVIGLIFAVGLAAIRG